MKKVKFSTVKSTLCLILCILLNVPAGAVSLAAAEPDTDSVMEAVAPDTDSIMEAVAPDTDSITEAVAPDTELSMDDSAVETFLPDTDTSVDDVVMEAVFPDMTDSVMEVDAPADPDEPSITEQNTDVSAPYTDLSVSDSFTVNTPAVSPDELSALSPDELSDDSAELFFAYLETRSGIYQDAQTFSSAGSALTGLNAWLYEQLSQTIVEIAAGHLQSTEISFTGEQIEQAGFTMHQDGLSQMSNFNAVADSIVETAGFEYDSLQDALIADFPYELYWFNKTRGIYQTMGYSYSGSGNRLTLSITGLNFSFPVSTAYRASGSNDYLVRSGLDSLIETTVSTAASIVAENAALPDYLKMTAYKDAISDLVEYNTGAASNASTPYGDPWQIVYVFDKDPETNVVCEGYAKAFQYLCDLSEFRGDSDCYSVTGYMRAGAKNPEAHMWNIAKLYGKYYLVDITNCDGYTETKVGNQTYFSYAVGYPDKLFLKAVTHAPENVGYTAQFNDYGGKLVAVYYTGAESPYAENTFLLSPSTMDFQIPAPLTADNVTVTFPNDSTSISAEIPTARVAHDGLAKTVSVTWADRALQTQAGEISLVYKQNDTTLDTAPVDIGTYEIYAQTSGGSHYAAIDAEKPLHIATLLIADETTPAPQTGIFAILYEDGEMVFQSDNAPRQDKPVVGVYNAQEWVEYHNDDYDYYYDVRPWYEQRANIKTVTFADKIQPESTSYWFYGCENLTDIQNMANLDTGSVTNMSYMFDYCSSLTTLDVSGFDTSSVTDMEEMFDGCSALTTLDLSSFDTSSVTYMGGMFRECTALTALDLSHFDTSSVTDMSWMFNNCSALTTLDLSNFDTRSVTNMYVMFGDCSSLTTLDVSSFDTGSVTSMGSMFAYCSALTTIYASASFVVDQVTESDEMFYGCEALVGGAGTKYDENHTNKAYAHIDGGTANPGYFTDKNAEPVRYLTVTLLAPDGTSRDVQIPRTDNAFQWYATYSDTEQLLSLGLLAVTGEHASVTYPSGATVAKIRFFTVNTGWTPLMECIEYETGGTDNPDNPNEPDTPDNPDNPDEPVDEATAYEREVIRLVNEIRVQNGLGTLSENTELSRIARIKSQDMHDNGYFEHTSPTYGTPFEMMESFGISYMTAGENIAHGYTTPQYVVDGWMNSEGHRANILNGNFTQIGMGYVADGRYWTQMFIG